MIIDGFTNNSIDIETNGGYTLEQVLNNTNCSKDPQYWYNIAGTNRYLFKSNIAESWEFYDNLIENPISNTSQIYIRFLDSSVFTTESDKFKRYNYYTNAPQDTYTYNAYWDLQEKYCFEGLEIGGVRVTGRYYFMLNFGRLKARTIDPDTGEESKRKIETFFRFLDHQYY